MSIGRLLRLIIRTGRVAEPVTDGVDHGLQIRDGFTPPRELRGSAQVRNMRVALERTWAAMPGPKWVVSIGDCTRGCGLFAGSYAVAGSVDDFVEVDVHVPGCPPTPEAIAAALRKVTGR